ncbi:MAG: ATP-grasp domain-containing protein [Gammaproteobacteria bacterium]|nr:ATP-grasp domain-containing protein [Gammaproteobacteria bacterium]
MKAILFLGTSLAGAKHTREAVEALGCYPIFLLKIADYAGEPREAIEKCEHHEADVNSLADIRRAIIENKLADKLVAVTSLLDETLHHACTIAEEFHIVGPDPTLRGLVNKAIVQSLIPEFSPPSLVFSPSKLTEMDVSAFFKAHKEFKQFFLKPTISSGAVGVSRLNKGASADEVKQIISQSHIEKVETQQWIIQPQITGHLYSLEGFVRAGHPNFLGFSRRARKGLTEISNEFPIDEDLSPQLQNRCKEAISALINRSGYMNGYFHCEFIIDTSTNQAYLTDGNMGRVAGAAIAPQIALSYKMKLTDLYKHVFDLGLFKEAHTKDYKYPVNSRRRTISIFYCLSSPAKILSIKLPKNMSSFHLQLAGGGVAKTSAGGSDSDWIGFIAGYKEEVLAELDHTSICTDQGIMKPFYLLDEAAHEQHEH